jgi:hypothetical protein
MAPSTRPGLLKKISIVTSDRWLRELILSYIDEVTKVDTTGWFHSPEFSLLAGLPAAKRYQFFGFVRGEIDNRLKSDSGSPSELEACANWWAEKTADRQTKALHHVFALAPDLASELEKAGLPVGDVLFDCVRRSYDNYSRQFYPNDEIGFVAGLHREKAFPHVHALVFPTTRLGRRMNFSRLAAARVDGRAVRIDFQGYLQDRFATNVERYRAMIAGRGRDGIAEMLPESTLLATVVTEIALEREKAGSQQSKAELIHEAGAAVSASADLSGDLIRKRKAALANLHSEREQVIQRGALNVLAETLAKGAKALQDDFTQTKGRVELEAIATRTARLTARLLETAANFRGVTPEHLCRPIDVAAVRSRRMGPYITENRLQQVFARARELDDASRRIVPLESLLNRDLAPLYRSVEATRGVPDAGPVVDVVDGSLHLAPKTPFVLASVNLAISAEQIAIEIDRRALDLELAAGPAIEDPAAP